MVNEAVIVELQAGINPKDFTVLDGATISKGTLCGLADSRGAGPSSGANPFAGIAAAGKELGDGSTELALHETGVFGLFVTSGAAITEGALVRLSGSNMITGGVVEAEIVAGKVCGKALEAVGAGTTATIEVDIGVRG